MFLGYPPGFKGYRLYDIENRRIFISRDVVFHEQVFHFHTITPADEAVTYFPNLPTPYGSSSMSPNAVVLPTEQLQLHFIELDILPASSSDNDEIGGQVPTVNDTSTTTTLPSDMNVETGGQIPNENDTSTSNPPHLTSDTAPNSTSVEASAPQNTEPRLSSRLTKLLFYLRDYLCSLLHQLDLSASY